MRQDSPEIMTPEQEAEKKRSVLQSLKRPAPRSAQAEPVLGEPIEAESVPQDVPPQVDANGIMDPAGIPFGDTGGDDDFTVAQPVPMAANAADAPQGRIMAVQRPKRRGLA